MHILLSASGDFCWPLISTSHWPVCGQSFSDLAFQIVHFVEANLYSPKLKGCILLTLCKYGEKVLSSRTSDSQGIRDDA